MTNIKAFSFTYFYLQHFYVFPNFCSNKYCQCFQFKTVSGRNLLIEIDLKLHSTDEDWGVAGGLW